MPQQGHLVNISSVFGLIGVPTQSAYNAAKFAVRGYTEALRQEMAGSNVHVCCVHPGGIKTNIAHAARGGDEAQLRKSAAGNLRKSPAPRRSRRGRRLYGRSRNARNACSSAWMPAIISLISRLFPVRYSRFMRRWPNLNAMTMTPPARVQEQSAGTRQRLLLTALHLYAAEGLHAVSLRRISTEAGSKNSAAMHYHFQNKLGVVQALVELIAAN